MRTIIYRNHVARRASGASYISHMEDDEQNCIKPMWSNISALLLRDWPQSLDIPSGAVLIPIRRNPVAARQWMWVAYHIRGVCAFDKDANLHEMWSVDQDEDTIRAVNHHLGIDWR